MSKSWKGKLSIFSLFLGFSLTYTNCHLFFFSIYVIYSFQISHHVLFLFYKKYQGSEGLSVCLLSAHDRYTYSLRKTHLNISQYQATNFKHLEAPWTAYATSVLTRSRNSPCSLSPVNPKNEFRGTGKGVLHSPTCQALC